ncbi:MAG: phosphoribosylformylglycinamidine synthase [Bacteroidales bacterium]|nr:phosphoribosylformylglycinamidine synthase [Candidatus Cryptobacteroides sp.]MED9899785.1 phosphoribosylformylglycinamidine synthase [Bacteroidales bacterium]HAW06240.1 phosphoribosylformylglycinamidine synthase [Rikenellaceae bacterium]
MAHNYRIFVEKYPEFQVEASSLRSELNENLQLDLQSLRLLNVYDLFGFTPELLEKSRYSVFGEIVTDKVSDECDLTGTKYIAVEYLPGQFDQRAASAVDCVHLIDPKADVRIKSSKLIILPADVEDETIAKIKHYFINAVESREKDLSKLTDSEAAAVKPVPVLDGFTKMTEADLEPFCRKMGLAMNADDLREVVKYFTEEGRDPNETELRILDTYWSDHCRHTTFTTELEEIGVEESFMKEDIDGTLNLYLKMRKELGREHKGLNLMDMATIGGRYLRKAGLLDDMEVSEENNACSIYIDVDVDGKLERWLLMFKNETHNHPTEIEPFGGAATCLGGAIRDPLSGRSYVYQAMRVTGAGDIWKPVAETLPGKLPQRVITKKAAHGYSSYGNQIGLATTHVREIYDEGYTAKRLEVGAVVGAVKADHVRRESPKPGDVVLLLGGRTGRDGIGGATGSSKEHTEESLETCGSEVQKGNAPEERKLQRLFRRPEVTELIKKSNDFGAGGVSVAIGELTDGLDIYLDRVPVKYNGLNATELAISESQERMSVVVEAKDEAKFMEYCHSENVEVTHVADVTDTERMRMFYGDKVVADLQRKFIDSAGAKHYAKAQIAAVEEKNPFTREVKGETLKEKLLNNLSDANVVSQKGLIEMFDSTIGRSTVLMPYGGELQLTETQVSVQKLPTDGYTDTASMMAFGFNPVISKWSPYHGAAYSMIEACAKVVAAGGRYEKMRFSCQEYFERMTHDPKVWGKPMSALLGSLKMQMALGLPSIGGKDSMSGTFEHINVPPTLISFGITTVNANNVISPELKWEGNRLWLVKHTPLKNYMPDVEQLKKNWAFVEEQIASGNAVSAWAVGFGGVAEGLCKMSFGNSFGVDVNVPENELFDYNYGSIILETEADLSFENAQFLGTVTSGVDGNIRVNGKNVSMDALVSSAFDRYEKVYPATSTPDMKRLDPKGTEGVKPFKAKKADLKYKGEKIAEPLAFLPVFPGTNCDYDSAKAFRKAGAKVKFGVFRNLTEQDVNDSIEEMKRNIDECQILMLCGGFSAGDEPDGSGKFIANVLNNEKIAAAIEALIARGGLILGICNGFQALVKSGLLPYGHLGCVTKDSPTLFRNDINRHISQIAFTRVASVNSPWLAGMTIGDTYGIPVSHGEGKFVVNEELAKELFDNGQVAFRYAEPIDECVTMHSPYNPNGSYYAIEGIISKNGQILGKMGHSERYENNLFKNIAANLEQPLFDNAVKYFRGE